MNDSEKIRRALALLHIQPTKFQSIHEQGNIEKVIELFQNGLNERTKKCRHWSYVKDYDESEQNTVGTLNNEDFKDVDKMRTIHEAFQFLCQTFADDVVKNTMANKKLGAMDTGPYRVSALILESKAMLDQVNRFQGRAKTGGWQSRKKMQAAANLISRDPRTPKDEMLILQNAPKKSKSKRASDSRIKKVQFDMSHEDGLSVSFDHPTRKKARIASLRKSKRFDGEEGKTFIEFFNDTKKERKEELATILKTSSSQSPTKTSKEVKSKKILEQKLSKNLFITWEDEDEDEEKVLPSNAKNSKDEENKDEEEEMFGENEDEKKESPSGSPRRQRRRGSGVQFELKKELSRMTQGPQTQKVASRVNRVQKWMKVLNSINNPPRKLNDIIHMQNGVEAFQFKKG